MPILHYSLGPMDNNSYVIVDEATGEAAVVDPSFDSEAILPDIEANGYTVRYILNTHAHFDHIVGNAFFVEQTGVPLALHPDDLDLLRALPQQVAMFGMEAEPSPDPTLLLEDGQTLLLGQMPIRVIHTPGHSPGGVTFLVEDAAIVGDCLFAGSVGRTDLPGASTQILMDTLQRRLLTLPDSTRVLPGHGPETTIGAERNTNPFLIGPPTRTGP